jgi:hypothetical protein
VEEPQKKATVKLSREDIPGIAAGTVIPASVQRAILEQEEAKKAKRENKSRFIIEIVWSLVCVVVGYLLAKFF